MKSSVLFHGGQLLYFPNMPIWTGVTTTGLGSFHAGANNVSSRYNTLMSVFNASKLFHITPNHKDTTFNPVHVRINIGKNPQIGDAAYIGDDKNGYIGIVHCSWITTLKKNIIISFLKQLQSQSSINPSSLNAFIYPGICQNCYEVKSDVKNHVNGFKNLEKFFRPNTEASWQLDLAGLIRQILIHSGVEEKNITTGNTCSACSSYGQINRNIQSFDQDKPILFSYRKKKEVKRNAVFAKMLSHDTILAGNTGDCPYVVLWKKP